MMARANRVDVRPPAASVFGALLLGAALFGCGPYPDLKVTVTAIPADATQLAVILWMSAPVPSNLDAAPPTPAKEMRVFDLPNPATTRSAATRDFEFGLVIDTPRNVSYQVNVAAFSPLAKPCLRIVTIGEQPANFNLESSVTIPMPPLVDGDLLGQQMSPTKRCYAGNLADQTAPLIASVGVDASWLSDASTPGLQALSVQGWNFQPKATPTVRVGTQPRNVARMLARSASELTLFLDATAFKDAYSGMPVSVTITNPDKTSATADVTLGPR